MKSCYLIVVFLVVSCGTNEIYEEEKLLSPKLIMEKELKLDSLTSNSPIVAELIDLGSSEFFALINSPDNTIKVYNFESGEIIKSLNFPSEGPNNVGRVGQFYFYNQDSLLISDYLPAFVTTVNYPDSSYRRHLLVSAQQRRNRFAMPRIFVGHRLTIIDDYLFLPLPDNRPFIADKGLGEEIDNKVVMKYDFVTGDQVYFGNYPTTYPNSEVTNKGLNIFLSPDLTNSLLMVSFPYRDSVSIYDLDGNFKRNVKIGFEFQQGRNTFKEINSNDPYEMYKNEIKISAYSSLLVDRINNKYLRVVESPIASLSEKKLQEKFNNPHLTARRPIKILVYDKDFNYEGTVTFPNKSDEYEPYNVLLSKYGIILLNRIKNNANEDYMHLDVFSIY